MLGSVLEGLPAIVLFGPLLFPVAKAMGVHEVHYAMVVILAMGIGLFAPPFGVGFYGACAIGRISPDDALWRIWPYIGALVVALDHRRRLPLAVDRVSALRRRARSTSAESGRMEYVTLGRTGIEVSVAGLGCGGFSRLGLGTGKSEAEAMALVHQAFDLGVNLFDTAAVYGTEAVLGKALKGLPRDRVVIATKAWIPRGGAGPRPSARRQPRQFARSCSASTASTSSSCTASRPRPTTAPAT